MSKNHSITVLAFAFSFLFLFMTSCRKGENDPLISLRTRKTRITGTWNLSSGTYSYYSPNIYNLDVEYDGSTAIEKLDGVTNNTFEYKIELTINKDYSFERISKINGFSKTEKGSWFFNKKSKDLGLKNKEAIIFTISSIKSAGITTTYTGATANELWLIDRLKNKEMIFKGERTYSSTSGTDTERYDFKYFK